MRLSLRKGAWIVSTPQASAGNRANGAPGICCKRKRTAIQVTDRRPHYNYQSLSISCRACPHRRGRLWPWPQPRSCMRRLSSYRNTLFPGSDRPWWRCLARPGRDHHRERERSVFLMLSWFWAQELQEQPRREQQAQQGQPLLLLEQRPRRARRRRPRTRSSHLCGHGTHRSCSRRSSRNRHCTVR